MYVRAAMMLPLKTYPVVSSIRDNNIGGYNKLLDAVVEEPVSNGWILIYSFVAAGIAFRVVRADDATNMVSVSTMHGNEATPLLEPVVSCSS